MECSIVWKQGMSMSFDQTQTQEIIVRGKKCRERVDQKKTIHHLDHQKKVFLYLPVFFACVPAFFPNKA